MLVPPNYGRGVWGAQGRALSCHLLPVPGLPDSAAQIRSLSRFRVVRARVAEKRAEPSLLRSPCLRGERFPGEKEPKGNKYVALWRIIPDLERFVICAGEGGLRAQAPHSFLHISTEHNKHSSLYLTGHSSVRFAHSGCHVFRKAYDSKCCTAQGLRVAWRDVSVCCESPLCCLSGLLCGWLKPCAAPSLSVRPSPLAAPLGPANSHPLPPSGGIGYQNASLIS
ncbi:hypothetical protein AAFF_G00258670 [Aldrovandia affinis]|uniref:Uncharacterized protein n=1 Tax=Aldrovandia affinis TaxID=143900 RepID=A0AAD7SUJ6_9TELE|nr:hypothetical protein AAFF_G00258670 [Aldrovandia affinis]